jgi:aerobic C4-dicarboxylate transport protein
VAWVGFLLGDHPESFVSAFVDGNLLQVLLVAVLRASRSNRTGLAGEKVQAGLEHVSKVFFGIVHLIMKLAPIGAFGAMAFTIGKYGIGTLVSLGWLLASVYLTCLIFIVVVLGLVARCPGFRCGSSCATSAPSCAGARHLVLGIGAAAAGRAAGGAGLRPRRGRPGGADRLLLQPRRHLHLPDDGGGVHRAGAGHPAGLGDQLLLLGVLLLTSKGAAGVTGSGFITLAATLGALGGQGAGRGRGADPRRGPASCRRPRAITNIIGNGVAPCSWRAGKACATTTRCAPALDAGPAAA